MEGAAHITDHTEKEIMMTTRSLALASRRPALLPRLWRALIGHLAFRQSLRELGRLDCRLLRDIGLTRAEAEAALQHRDWDVPPHWRA
jgi:uncharacterized protein YjiS (DUF1127 family)